MPKISNKILKVLRALFLIVSIGGLGSCAAIEFGSGWDEQMSGLGLISLFVGMLSLTMFCFLMDTLQKRSRRAEVLGAVESNSGNATDTLARLTATLDLETSAVRKGALCRDIAVIQHKLGDDASAIESIKQCMSYSPMLARSLRKDQDLSGLLDNSEISFSPKFAQMIQDIRRVLRPEIDIEQTAHETPTNFDVLSDDELRNFAADWGMTNSESLSREELIQELREAFNQDFPECAGELDQENQEMRPVREAGRFDDAKFIGGCALVGISIWEFSTRSLSENYLLPAQDTDALRSLFSSGLLPILLGLWGLKLLWDSLSPFLGGQSK